MKKNLLPIICIFTSLLLSFGGCGKDSTKSEKSQDNTETEENQDNTEAEENQDNTVSEKEFMEMASTFYDNIVSCSDYYMNLCDYEINYLESAYKLNADESAENAANSAYEWLEKEISMSAEDVNNLFETISTQYVDIISVKPSDSKSETLQDYAKETFENLTSLQSIANNPDGGYENVSDAYNSAVDKLVNSLKLMNTLLTK